MANSGDEASVNSSSQILLDVQNLAKLAVDYDQNNDYEAAIYYYDETVHLLRQYIASNENESIKNKLRNYENRAKVLRDKHSKLLQENYDLHKAKNKKFSESEINIGKLEFLLNEALDEDEQNKYDEALENYLQAVETGLEIKKSINDEKASHRITQLITQALDRAEFIKKLKSGSNKIDSLGSQINSSLAISNNSPVKNVNSVQASTVLPSSQQHINTGQDTYTKQEILVLKRSSTINGIEFVPFMANIDLREKFFTLSEYCDPIGLLQLSAKQKTALVAFRRVSELSEEPKIIANPNKIDCFAIKQTIVTDCSFIASLTVAALYERRFSKKIISHIIYPQNRNREPVYNPCGKYMVKFNINGIWRKVVIDDRLPVGNFGQLLCSYSSNKNEFWVSLMEKAYLKVMGGYDFPGSNSNIDLHALTGWIPERIMMETSNKEGTFKSLLERYEKGDVLITFATGEMSDSVSERTGLVSGHAYAMLDIKFVQGHKLLLLKNPWSHMRWKGKFSERDVSSWTPSLREALQYDPKNAKNFDNGVFWIDLDSLVNFFDVCYLSWNPSLFKYSYCTHDIWNAGVGPAKDLYYIGDNPQYSLTAKSGDCTVWILLTRHILDRNDFANNCEYIALLVYKNNGEKVYIPFDPKPFIDGVRINSPHYLCKIVVNKNNPITKYTLVISQYEKSNTILYTLKAFSTAPFSLKKIVEEYSFKETDKNGQWTRETAGGCRNHPSSYSLNPVYNLQFNGSAKEEDNKILIELRGPKDYAIGLEMTTITTINPNSVYLVKRLDTGSFRSGYTYLKVSPIPAGSYQIIPSTFNPGQVGPFFLTVKATHSIKLTRVK